MAIRTVVLPSSTRGGIGQMDFDWVGQEDDRSMGLRCGSGACERETEEEKKKEKREWKKRHGQGE
jgi:hypothetical protein